MTSSAEESSRFHSLKKRIETLSHLFKRTDDDRPGRRAEQALLGDLDVLRRGFLRPGLADEIRSLTGLATQKGEGSWAQSLDPRARQWLAAFLSEPIADASPDTNSVTAIAALLEMTTNPESLTWLCWYIAKAAERCADADAIQKAWSTLQRYEDHSATVVQQWALRGMSLLASSLDVRRAWPEGPFSDGLSEGLHRLLRDAFPPVRTDVVELFAECVGIPDDAPADTPTWLSGGAASEAIRLAVEARDAVRQKSVGSHTEVAKREWHAYERAVARLLEMFPPSFWKAGIGQALEGIVEGSLRHIALGGEADLPVDVQMRAIRALVRVYPTARDALHKLAPRVLLRGNSRVTLALVGAVKDRLIAQRHAQGTGYEAWVTLLVDIIVSPPSEVYGEEVRDLLRVITDAADRRAIAHALETRETALSEQEDDTGNGDRPARRLALARLALYQDGRAADRVRAQTHAAERRYEDLVRETIPKEIASAAKKNDEAYRSAQKMTGIALGVALGAFFIGVFLILESALSSKADVAGLISGGGLSLVSLIAWVTLTLRRANRMLATSHLDALHHQMLLAEYQLKQQRLGTAYVELLRDSRLTLDALTKLEEIAGKNRLADDLLAWLKARFPSEPADEPTLQK